MFHITIPFLSKCRKSIIPQLVFKSQINPRKICGKIVGIYHSKQFENGLVILSTEKDYNDLGIGFMCGTTVLKDKIDEIVMLKDDNAIVTILDMNEEMIEKVVENA